MVRAPGTPGTTVTGKITTAFDGQVPPGRGSQTAFENHCTPIPLAAGAGEIVSGPVTSGRSVARPVNELALAPFIRLPCARLPSVAALPASNVTGFPPCDCSMNESCHPSLNWLPLNGSSYKPLITNR